MLTEQPGTGETTSGARPREVGAWAAVAVVGLAACCVVLALGARYAVDPELFTPAWPLVGVPAFVPPAAQRAVGLGILAGSAVLVAGWAWLAARAGRVRLRVAAVAAGAWAVPLAVGPPLLSRDVFSYAAVGRLAVAGLDPYLVGPAALGGGSFLSAVDPLWRETPTPYGPVTVALLHGAAVVGSGSVLGTVLALRVAAVLTVLAAVAAAVSVAAPRERTTVLVLTAMSPVVLLHLVSGTHLDAAIGAGAIGVVVLTVRGRPLPAVVLAVAFGMVKAPAFLLVGFVLLAAVRHAPPGRRLRTAARLTAAGAAALAVCWAVLPDAFGWLGALDVPAMARRPQAPSAWLGSLVQALSGGSLSEAAATGAARAATLGAGALVALALLVRGTARPGDRRAALRGVGWGLVVLALSGPVLYGWYLAWGTFALVAGGRARDRAVLAVVSVAVLVLGLPGGGPGVVGVQLAGWAADAVVAGVAAAPALRRRPG